MIRINDEVLTQLDSFGTYTSRSGSDESILLFSDPCGFECEWTKFSLVFVSLRDCENENLPKCIELATEIKKHFDRFQEWLKQEALERLEQDGFEMNGPSIPAELSSCEITISVYDKFDVYGWNGCATFNLTMSDGDLLVVPISFPT